MGKHCAIPRLPKVGCHMFTALGPSSVKAGSMEDAGDTLHAQLSGDIGPKGHRSAYGRAHIGTPVCMAEG